MNSATELRVQAAGSDRFVRLYRHILRICSFFELRRVWHCPPAGFYSTVMAVRLKGAVGGSSRIPFRINRGSRARVPRDGAVAPFPEGRP